MEKMDVAQGVEKTGHYFMSPVEGGFIFIGQWRTRKKYQFKG